MREPIVSNVSVAMDLQLYLMESPVLTVQSIDACGL